MIIVYTKCIFSWRVFKILEPVYKTNINHDLRISLNALNVATANKIYALRFTVSLLRCKRSNPINGYTYGLTYTVM